MNAVNHHQIQDLVIGVLQEITQDWDLDLAGGFRPETLLIADLAFESIDLVQFAVSLEQAIGQKGLPFENLFMKDGDYVDDLSIAQVVEFLTAQVGQAGN
jgi:acyl carrier protein